MIWSERWSTTLSSVKSKLQRANWYLHLPSTAFVHDDVKIQIRWRTRFYCPYGTHSSCGHTPQNAMHNSLRDIDFWLVEHRWNMPGFQQIWSENNHNQFLLWIVSKKLIPTTHCQSELDLYVVLATLILRCPERLSYKSQKRRNIFSHSNDIHISPHIDTG